jgi:hypothetical protein
LITDSLLASNSSIHDGGGLANFGNAEIRNSLLTRNSGRGGGAVMNTGTLTITGSTLSGNSATWRGGGVKTGRSDSTATITDSTLTRNVAVDRAGGIHNEGELHLSNSIVAGNSSVAFANYFGTELVTDSFNLIDVEAMLRPLADNGGSTLTHALEVGSPAIDAGDPTRTTGDGSTPDYDQRGIGFNRIVGQRIDIGAFERQISADLNFDGSIDGTDIDLLQANITNGPAEPSLFDLTQDGIVDLADRDQWLWEAGRAILPTDQAFPLGDANLDGVVDTSDFAIWNNNKFSLDSNWTSGDFDADGAIDTSDFSIWNEHKFSTADNVHASLHIARPHDRRESRETHERAFDAREEFIWLDRIYVEFTFAKMDDGSIAGR